MFTHLSCFPFFLHTDAIYVRVYESRMDLLRAVIVGPADTPYHDGLFVFDVHFPPTYPDIPPVCVWWKYPILIIVIFAIVNKKDRLFLSDGLLLFWWPSTKPELV